METPQERYMTISNMANKNEATTSLEVNTSREANASSEQPIVACCTPQGTGAIALIRISGRDASKIVDKFSKLSSKELLSSQKTHSIHHGHIVNHLNKSEIIDEVLFLHMLAPKTFTGEDTIEITCHNNPFIIEQIISQAIACGARSAERGEFTKQAVLNNKIDLLQAESINELIAAQSEITLKQSFAQLKGTLSNKINDIEHELISLLTTVEASFEFLEEEQRDVDFDNIIRKKLKALLEETNGILKNFSAQKQIRDGIRIALIGKVNVGKSTLFNTLIEKERAIVTDIPGTTRDAIETTIHKNGVFLTFVDTAGLRNTSDSIEKEGIKHTWKEAMQSDIILLVHDATEKLFSAEEELEIKNKYPEKIIEVINKSDLFKNKPTDTLSISAKEKTGIEKLQQMLKEKIDMISKNGLAPFLLNQRQYKLISELDMKLKQLDIECASIIQYEIVALHLRGALELIAQLIGRGVSEKVISFVFKEFCIGK